MNLDVLAIGAHPDDADLGVGGALIKLARRGYRTGILDLSRGELATRGDENERAAEAEEAGRRLGLARRDNAGLPDGGIANTPEQRLAVIEWIRRLRPAMLLAPMAPDRHPDHTAAHGLVRDAIFLAGLSRIDTGSPPHRPASAWHYHAYHEGPETPPVVIDISEVYEEKRHALAAFASQFYNPDYPAPETYVASKAFRDAMEHRAAYWGARIGAAYGEPLHGAIPLWADLPPGLGAPGG